MFDINKSFINTYVYKYFAKTNYLFKKPGSSEQVEFMLHYMSPAFSLLDGACLADILVSYAVRVTQSNGYGTHE